MEINMNKELAEVCILLSKYKGATKEQKDIFKTYSKVFMNIGNEKKKKRKLITEDELYSFVYREATRDYPMKYYPHKEWMKFRRRFKYFFDKLEFANAKTSESQGGKKNDIKW